MKKQYKYAIIYIVGGLYYALIEILWRGYSHWTMILTGGICVLCLYIIDEKLSNLPFALRCLMGGALITTVEFAVGTVVNTVLRWDVWDYSDESYNIMGQICLTSSLIWIVLCIPGLAACSIVQLLFDNSEEKCYEENNI